MGKINAVLFDCWDTVIHYQESKKNKGIELLLDVCENPKKVKKAELVECFRNLMVDYYRISNDFDVRFLSLFRYLCASNGLIPKIPYEEIERLYNQHIVPTPVKNLDKVLSFLEDNKVKVGVCSNTIHSEEDTRAFLAACWPSMPFDFVMTSSTYAVKKPSGRFFEIGAKLAGTTNDKVVYVGDNFYADVFGSWCAFYEKSIWFNPYRRSRDLYYRAHPEMSDNIEYREISDYLELIPILRELL